MTTIRDPQTDVSTADYTIGGDWSFDKKLTYNSSLGFTANTDIVDKQYVDSRVVGAVDESNIYYVGKHGNDVGNDGQNIEEAFLTIQKGIDEANAQGPGISDQYAVKINDGGSYDSFTLIAKPYIHLDAPSAQLQTLGSTYGIGDNNSLLFDKATFAAGSGTLFTQTGTGNASVRFNQIYGASAADRIFDISGETLYVTGDNMDNSPGSEAFRVRSLSTLNANVKQITGQIVLDTLANATITTNNLWGNITVGVDASVTIIINGPYLGDIIAASGARIRMLVGFRGSYNDSIDPDADVGIEYLGGHDDSNHLNVLVGGDYHQNPRQQTPTGTITSTADDFYIADNTILLSEAGNVVEVLLGSSNNLGLEIVTANQQFGILIPVEHRDTFDIIGDVASISFRAAWTDVGTRKLRAALISWSGSQDSITTDVVNTWGVTPSLVANWTYENTPADLTVGGLGVYETFKIENIAVDTVSATNIAVFIWVAETTTVIGETLQISNVRCNKGVSAGEFSPRSYGAELALCQRYYAKSYSALTHPTTVTRIGSQSVDKGAAGTSGFIGMNVRFPVDMFYPPQLVPFSTGTGLSGQIHIEGGADVAATSSSVATSGGQIVEVSPLVGTFHASYQWVADARF